MRRVYQANRAEQIEEAYEWQGALIAYRENAGAAEEFQEEASE